MMSIGTSCGRRGRREERNTNQGSRMKRVLAVKEREESRMPPSVFDLRGGVAGNPLLRRKINKYLKA